MHEELKICVSLKHAMHHSCRLPLAGDLPEHDVQDLQGLLWSIGLPPGDELPEVVQVGPGGEFDGHLVLPLPAGTGEPD